MVVRTFPCFLAIVILRQMANASRLSALRRHSEDDPPVFQKSPLCLTVQFPEYFPTIQVSGATVTFHLSVLLPFLSEYVARMRRERKGCFTAALWPEESGGAACALCGDRIPPNAIFLSGDAYRPSNNIYGMGWEKSRTFRSQRGERILTSSGTMVTGQSRKLLLSVFLHTLLHQVIPVDIVHNDAGEVLDLQFSYGF